MKEKAEQIAPLLKEAIAAGIRQHELVAQIEEILAGPEKPEITRQWVENTVMDFIQDSSADSETAEGYGIEDALVLIEELE